MKCPHCLGEVPDTNYKCPHCNKVIGTGPDPLRQPRTPSGGKPFNLSAFFLVVIVIGISVIGFLMIQQGKKSGQDALPSGAAEPHQPGERVNLKDLIAPGKITIFDFYSDFCGPCRKISPRLEQLDELNDDIAVVKIDINRKNVNGIDWNSPVARQYNLRSIPHFIIYDTSGNQSHEGSSAWRQVYQYLKEKNL